MLLFTLLSLGSRLKLAWKWALDVVLLSVLKICGCVAGSASLDHFFLVSIRIDTVHRCVLGKLGLKMTWLHLLVVRLVVRTAISPSIVIYKHLVLVIFPQSMCHVSLRPVNIIIRILVAALIDRSRRVAAWRFDCMASLRLSRAWLLHFKFGCGNISQAVLTSSSLILARWLPHLCTAPTLRRSASSTSSVPSDVGSIPLKCTPSSPGDCLSCAVVRRVLDIILHEW